MEEKGNFIEQLETEQKTVYQERYPKFFKIYIIIGILVILGLLIGIIVLAASKK